MQSKYRDFDAYWAEQESEPVRFKALGKEYELPPSFPARVAVEIERIRMDGAEADRSRLTDLALSLISRAQLEDMYSRGLTGHQLGDLISWIFKAYMDTDSDEGDDPNPQAPTHARRPHGSRG